MKKLIYSIVACIMVSCVFSIFSATASKLDINIHSTQETSILESQNSHFFYNSTNNSSNHNIKNKKKDGGDSIIIINLPSNKKDTSIKKIDNQSIKTNKIKKILKNKIKEEFKDFEISIEYKDSFLLYDYLGVSYRTIYGAKIPQNKEFLVIKYSYEIKGFYEIEGKYERTYPTSEILFIPIDGSKYCFTSYSYISLGTHYVKVRFLYGDKIYNVVEKFSDSWNDKPELQQIYNLLFNK